MSINGIFKEVQESLKKNVIIDKLAKTKRTTINRFLNSMYRSEIQQTI